MATLSPESGTAPPPITQRWATTILEGFHHRKAGNSPTASRRLEWRPLKVLSTSPLGDHKR